MERRTPSQAAPAARVYAVTEAGPREVEGPAGATSMHAVLAGLPEGVYTGLRSFGKGFVGLEAHLARTERSMALLGWKEPLERERLLDALQAAVDAWPGDARVRIDVLERPQRIGGVEARIFLGLAPAVEVPRELIERGVRVPLAPEGLSRERPLVKTTAFVRARSPHPRELREDFDRLLVDARGRALECTSANLFGVRGRTLVTADDGVLQGVTRGLLLRLAPEAGLEFAFERLDPARAGDLDEAFLASSTRGVVPVVELAGRRVGGGEPGPRTERLRAAYDALVRREARPAR